MRIAVLVSGGGTNLQAIIDRIDDGLLSDVQIAVVVSSSRDAYAIERAENNGIPVACIIKREFPTQEAYDQAMLSAIQQSRADLIVLAGYLSLLSSCVVNQYKNRIINIHPSLIPAFCGAGMYGIRPHEAALKRGVKISGATVHIVDSEYDEGPIIIQKAIDISPDDTPQTLQKRIMTDCEQVILPQAIQLFAQERVVVEGRVARIIDA
ncbi:MAG: phosphoribosylglycinamide formyltransferase [Clostridiaceae bacterium]|mgnify:CR=1 FL=1|nr:phosphoribosylglycinamide formyltransferase [Clostridiaceae bacterium]